MHLAPIDVGMHKNCGYIPDTCSVFIHFIQVYKQIQQFINSTSAGSNRVTIACIVIIQCKMSCAVISF